MSKQSVIPAELNDFFVQAWSHFKQTCPDDLYAKIENLEADAEIFAKVARVWSISEYVAKQCQRNPQSFFKLLESGRLGQANTDDWYQTTLQRQIAQINAEEDLLRVLRVFRNREMVRIIWRDQLAYAELRETITDLTDLAEACINVSLNWLYEAACKRQGVPMGTGETAEQRQHLVVIGMGKLGAWELNLSSDIDLIFAYPSKGSTDRGIDNQQFFTRLAQRLIHSLDARTADGFAFRVDMRLRPYGQSGALVLNFDAMLDYYQTQGREWERYAFIKARVVAGDQLAGAQLMGELKPFVFRRYLDFGAIKALRDMKELIRREEHRRGLQQDVKLGAGGIREIEFIVQVFQLVRGGTDARLQESRLLVVTDTLIELGMLTESAVKGLVAAYIFLRKTEHALQALRDEQTQKLPENSLDQARVAYALGYSGWEDFSDQLKDHRRIVREQFNALIEEPVQVEDQGQTASVSVWQQLWLMLLDKEHATGLLEDSGFQDPESTFNKIISFRESRKVGSLQDVALERLDQFMPLMLEEVSRDTKPDVTFERVLLLVEAVIRRTVYLVLLVENPAALKQLRVLCSASPWIASVLTRHPVLLDNLIDARELYSPVGAAELSAELREQLMRIPVEDTEQQMDCMRQFKNEHLLRVAASEVTEVLPLMKVSDYLTYIAEAVLKSVLDLVWPQAIARYGIPQQAKGEPCEQNFIIVGYGKLGGLELSYGSDLDLVFVHDAPINQATNGEKPIENPVFYTRLAQKIIHFLSASTANGQLYEVDMRLRPSGNSGLLVTSLVALTKYQQQQAWLWEHQALVRARVVAGPADLKKRFEELRFEILSKPRDREEVRVEVIKMRDKIRASHGSPEGDQRQFSLKYDGGGIVDIEFLVQYGVLAWGHDYPVLIEYTDNVRLLDALEQVSLLSSEQAEKLREAYTGLRSVGHRLAIDNRKAVLQADELEEFELLGHRSNVIQVWDQFMAARH